MRKGKNKGYLPIIIVLIVLTIIAGAYLYGKKLYNETITNIDKQISELPKFDEKAETEKIASELHIPYPITAPKINKNTIKKKAEKKARAMTLSKYPKKKLMVKVRAILKQIKSIKEGQYVTFYLKTIRKCISGKCLRIQLINNKKVVNIDLNKYMYNDISEEYRYLFDNSLAYRQAKVAVKAAKNKFKQKSSEYYQKVLTRSMNKLYLANGYVKKNGVWASHQEIVTNMLADRKLNFQRRIRKKKAAIIDKNQLFGFIPLSPKKAKNDADSASWNEEE
jgi:hypothetical protein